jgi:hypothetical protein
MDQVPKNRYEIYLLDKKSPDITLVVAPTGLASNLRKPETEHQTKPHLKL